MKKLNVVAWLMAIAISSSVFAGPGKGGAKVDVKKSSLKWLAKKVTGKHNGTVSLASGLLESNGKTITGGTFEIDMNSIICEDLSDKETNGKLVGHLKSDDFFSVAKNPKAKFEITKVTPKAGTEVEITGKMTIKGITNEIVFPANVQLNGKEISATAKITLDRTKWDIRFGSGKFFENLGDKVIYDDFEIDLALVAQ